MSTSSDLLDLFKHNPSEDSSVDPEYELIADPRWTVQDCRAYGGRWAVNEHAPDGTAAKDFWMKDHGAFSSRTKAMEVCLGYARAAGVSV